MTNLNLYFLLFKARNINCIHTSKYHLSHPRNVGGGVGGGAVVSVLVDTGTNPTVDTSASKALAEELPSRTLSHMRALNRESIE